MRKRNVLAALATLGALYAVREALKMAGEVRRYNHILSMSNEGTVSQELPELMIMAAKQQKQTAKEWMALMRSAPKDLMRYLKIESM